MRNTIVKQIEDSAQRDKNIMVITADLGYSVFEPFAEKLPNQFINVGISEQAMSSIAAGLALCGKMVFTYSIGNFATLRCIEQIRNDICYHNANVKIIAVGGGFSYGQLGMSHHATEDIAMMRCLPNMKVFVPADPEEATEVILYALQNEGPCYIRLARKGEPVLYKKALENNMITNMQEVIRGSDILLLATGPLLREAIIASKLLKAHNISVAVYSVPCIKPLDTDTLHVLSKKYSNIVSLEEHQIAGGLGSALAEELCKEDLSHTRLHRLGLHDEFTSIVGDHEYLCDYYGLSSSKIVKFICRLREKDEANCYRCK